MSFPGRNDCLACHTERAGGVLSFNTRQLNRTVPGGTQNQLAVLAQMGYFPSITPPDAIASVSQPGCATWAV